MSGVHVNYSYHVNSGPYRGHLVKVRMLYPHTGRCEVVLKDCWGEITSEVVILRVCDLES